MISNFKLLVSKPTGEIISGGFAEVAPRNGNEIIIDIDPDVGMNLIFRDKQGRKSIKWNFDKSTLEEIPIEERVDATNPFKVEWNKITTVEGKLHFLAQRLGLE